MLTYAHLSFKGEGSHLFVASIGEAAGSRPMITLAARLSVFQPGPDNFVRNQKRNSRLLGPSGFGVRRKIGGVCVLVR
jgi:hypothetical protein